MSSTYEGDPEQFPEDFPVLDDGDAAEAASIAPALEANGDRTAWLRARLLGAQIQNIQNCTTTSLEIDEPIVGWCQGLGGDGSIGGAWVIAGADNGGGITTVRSIDEVTFTDISYGAFAGALPYTWFAAKLYDDAPTLAGAFVIGSPGDETVAFNRGGVFQNVALPEPLTSCGTTCGVWSTTNTRFVIGGVDFDQTPDVPMFWRMTADAAPATAAITPSKVNSLRVQCMAVNQAAPRIVAFGDQANADSWYSDDGGGSWTLVATTIDNVLAIAYSPTCELWMLITSGGETWTSTTGISGWTLVNTFASTAFEPTRATLVEHDGLWLTAMNTGNHVLYSVDRGVTWRAVRLSPTGVAVDVSTMAYSPQRRRFGIASRVDTNETEFHRSLAIGLGPEAP